jgi:hypothetical protein
VIYFGPYSDNYLGNLEKLLTSFQKNKLRLNYQVVVYVTLMLSLPVVKKSLSMRKVDPTYYSCLCVLNGELLVPSTHIR